MKIKLEALDGNIVVVVTQMIWGEEVEILRQDVTKDLSVMINLAQNQLLNKSISVANKKLLEGEV